MGRRCHSTLKRRVDYRHTIATCHLDSRCNVGQTTSHSDSIEDSEELQGFDRGWTTAAEKHSRRSARWKLVGRRCDRRCS